MQDTKILALGLLAMLTAGAFSQARAAEGDIYKVGSWVSYKMSMKTNAAEMADAAMGGGSADQAADQGTAAAMGMGMSPEIMNRLPPDQREKLMAQMKAAQAQGAAARAQAMKGHEAQMGAAKAQMKGMGAAGGNAAADVMKDFRMKISVVGKEKRDGKDCIWLELAIIGKFPDLDKMMAGYSGMMAQMSEEDKAKMQKSMADAKKKMEKNPMRTKDGRLKMVMKILVEKPDPKAAVELNPIEVWKKQGDNPVVKLTAEQMAHFAKGETKSTRKSSGREQSEDAMHSDTEITQHLNSDEAKRAEIEEKTDKLGQAAQMGKAVAKVIPGGQVAAAGLGVLGELSNLVSDVNNLQVDMKMSMDVKSKTDISHEDTSTSVTALISKDSQVIGGESVKVEGLGAVKAAHTQAKEIRERTDTSKSKITDAKIETSVKMDMSGGIGVDGGAKSTTGKAVGGLVKGAKFLSDPFGRKKKQADEQQAALQKGISEGVSNGVKGMETNMEQKTQVTEYKDYWISPEIPAMGLVKMEQATEEEKEQQNVNISGGMYGNGMDQGMNPMGNPMMGGMGKQPKQKNVIATTIDQMGTSGAKSELE